MRDTGNAKDCLELPPTNFSMFSFKKLDLISFTVQYRGIFFYFVLFL